jgi:hypothetical protein
LFKKRDSFTMSRKLSGGNAALPQYCWRCRVWGGMLHYPSTAGAVVSGGECCTTPVSTGGAVRQIAAIHWNYSPNITAHRNSILVYYRRPTKFNGNMYQYTIFYRLIKECSMTRIMETTNPVTFVIWLSLFWKRDHSFAGILTLIWMRGECDECNGFYEV